MRELFFKDFITEVAGHTCISKPHGLNKTLTEVNILKPSFYLRACVRTETGASVVISPPDL